MSHKVERSNPHNACCSEKVKDGAYGTAVTLVALAVIFGALVLVTQHYGLNWGPLNDPMKQFIQLLGKYTFVPLAASSGLLALLIVVGIVWKCPIPKPPKKEKEPTPPPATQFNMKEPIPKTTAQPPKPPVPQKGAVKHPHSVFRGRDVPKNKDPIPWGKGPIDLADPRLQYGLKVTSFGSSEEETVKGFHFTQDPVKRVTGTKQYPQHTAQNRMQGSGGFSGPNVGLASLLGNDYSDSD